MSDRDELAIYRTALGSSRRHWVWARGPDLRVTFVSPGFREATGIAPEAIIGRLPDAVMDGLFFDSQKAHHDALEARRPFFDTMYRSVDSEGKVHWLRTSGWPHWDETGAFAGFAGIGADVTDEVEAARVTAEAEAALRQSQDLLQAVFNGTVGLIMVLDPEGRLMEVNQACLDLLDITRSEVLGTEIGESPWFRESRSRERVRAAVARSKDGGHESGEVFMMSRGRAARIIDLSIKPVFDADGRVELIIAEGRDVTESKRMLERNRALELERLQGQKMESLGTLAGGIAHEINTPIQYVGDNIEFIRNAVQDLAEVLHSIKAAVKVNHEGDWRSARELLAIAADAADIDFLLDEMPSAIDQTIDGVTRVRQIVTAIKEFSHPDNKDKQPHDLARAIETTMTISRNQWKYAADIETEFDPELPPVYCHLGELNQVFLNLIVNAAHAIEEKSGERGTIRITTRRLGDQAEIRIADTGVGIRPENLDRIYDLFFTTKPPGKGTGQGLAICHKIVTRTHRGTINVESVVGQGTCFVLTLPIEDVLAPTDSTPA